MKMISFCNKKGGVGKTTLCKNVAYKLALDKNKVLLIDLDTQATLTLLTRTTENFNTEKTLHKIIASDCEYNIKNIIQPTKYKNIDIIAGGESLKKSLLAMKEFYSKGMYFQVGFKIYNEYKSTFDSYDYVLIDYPPSTDDLSLSWLIFSDLIVVPTNLVVGSYKGILDLNNNLEIIAKELKTEKPEIKILFNSVLDTDNQDIFKERLKENNLYDKLLNIIIRHSGIFNNSENDFNSIWENPYYWRQKQAYEELIKEIK
ncbi:ParA family protein [Spiroplasma endosymbiont of Megaselia nigra]|uniref:ParA family protein n=1 Tax=Spiroplasma endosymbiont of Megaselia nigra TaxID=2478537 RepID=UPI00131555DA|nr:ParA family protein [Spiroplasma endosymbiont of Megaselia nigra]